MIKSFSTDRHCAPTGQEKPLANQGEELAAPVVTARSGVFGEFQQLYAEHGIATFPMKFVPRDGGLDKVPMVRGWPKIGLNRSRELASDIRFAAAEGMGYRAGLRAGPHGIAVGDVDSTDERFLQHAIDRLGEPRVVVRTASGKFHLLYRFAGEQRKIRPWKDEGLPIDILGDGIVVAPPSHYGKHSYAIIHGSLDDLDNLTEMRGVEALKQRVEALKQPINEPQHSGERIRQGNRNDTLYRSCLREAPRCDTLDDLMEIARTINNNFIPPLDDREVIRTATSAWNCEVRGDNLAGRGRFGAYLSKDVINHMIRLDRDALCLLMFLKGNNGPEREFMIANGLSEAINMPLRVLQRARETLIEEGFIIKTRAAVTGQPALYRFAQQERRRTK